MRRMNFDVKCVRDYLLSHNEVYTVRGYKYDEHELALVYDIGMCDRKFISKIEKKEDLIPYVDASGFVSIGGWWNRIIDYCGNREKFLYHVKVIHSTEPNRGYEKV